MERQIKATTEVKSTELSTIVIILFQTIQKIFFEYLTVRLNLLLWSSYWDFSKRSSQLITSDSISSREAMGKGFLTRSHINCSLKKRLVNSKNYSFFVFFAVSVWLWEGTTFSQIKIKNLGWVRKKYLGIM